MIFNIEINEPRSSRSIRSNIHDGKKRDRLSNGKERHGPSDPSISGKTKGSFKVNKGNGFAKQIVGVKVNVGPISDFGSMSRSNRDAINPGETVKVVDKFRERGGLLNKFSDSGSGKISEPKVRPGVESGKGVSIDQRKGKVIRNNNIRNDVEPVVLSTSIGRISKVFRRISNSMHSSYRFASNILNSKTEKILIIFGVPDNAKEAMSAEEEGSSAVFVVSKQFGRHTPTNITNNSQVRAARKASNRNIEKAKATLQLFSIANRVVGTISAEIRGMLHRGGKL